MAGCGFTGPFDCGRCPPPTPSSGGGMNGVSSGGGMNGVSSGGGMDSVRAKGWCGVMLRRRVRTQSTEVDPKHLAA